MGLAKGEVLNERDVAQYFRKAEELARRTSGAQKFPIGGPTEGVIRYVKNGRYVDIASDGRIVSFGAR